MSDETNSAATADVDFLVATVKAIVDNPDEVIAERSVEDLGVLLKLRVNEADMSKVVGKEGRTAKALRTLLRLVGSKFDQRVNLKILEPDGSERRVERPVVSQSSKIEAPAEKPAGAEKLAEDANTKKDQPAKFSIQAGREGDNASESFENVI